MKQHFDQPLSNREDNVPVVPPVDEPSSTPVEGEAEFSTAERHLHRQQSLRRRWYAVAVVLCVVILGGTMWLSQREGIRLATSAAMLVQTPTLPSPTAQPANLTLAEEQGRITVIQQLPEGAIVGDTSKTLFRFRLQSLSETGEVLDTQYRQMSFRYGLYAVDDGGYTIGKITFDNLPEGRYRVSQMSLSEEERRGLKSSTTTGILEDHIATFWIGVTPTEEELSLLKEQARLEKHALSALPIYDASVTFLLQNKTSQKEEGDPPLARINC